MKTLFPSKIVVNLHFNCYDTLFITGSYLADWHNQYNGLVAGHQVQITQKMAQCTIGCFTGRFYLPVWCLGFSLRLSEVCFCMLLFVGLGHPVLEKENGSNV
jgi:hypothetical protein